MGSDTPDLFDQAQAEARAGQADAAAETLARLLDGQPGHWEGWALLAGLQLDQGDARAALDSYNRALAIRPGALHLLVNRGNALAALGRHDEAIEDLDRVLADDASLAVAHSNRARSLNALRRWTEALASAERAIALAPQLANAWRHRAGALAGLQRFEAAHDAYCAAAERTPAGPPRAGLELEAAVCLGWLGRLDAALAAFDALVDAHPDWALPRYRRAHVRLLRGRFAEGWDDHEARWRDAHFIGRSAGLVNAAVRSRLTTHPTPETFHGRRVLVVSEQGVGDEIMFASVLPDVAAVAAKVTFWVEPRLQALIAHSMPQVEVVAGYGPAVVDLDAYDVVVAAGSLPAAFRRAAADFPGRPYLTPRPATVEAWRARLGPRSARLRVGLSWRGGTAATQQGARSIGLEALRPLAARSDCAFVSLQYGDVAAELAAFNATLPRPVTSFAPAEIDDFDALAGLVANLDAVVTVQTAAAHLAGALGRPTLVMIPQRPEWRYGDRGARMPWYASLQLFRLGAAESWPDVVPRIAAALDAVEPG